jgi:cytochrome P450
MTDTVADSIGSAGLPPRPDYDLLAPQARADPHPLLHRMRAEDPVHWSPQLNRWVLTRYADIVQALRDPGLTAAQMVGQLDLLPDEQRRQVETLRASIAMWMGHTNRDDHVRMQRVIKRYFSPNTVEALRPRAQAITDELIDAFYDRGECDIVAELARPLPARVIADMLGVPAEDRDLLPAWSRAISAVFQPLDLPSLLQSQQSITEMAEYLRPIVAARREEPRDDIISVLIAAQEQGTVLSEEEILANCVLLLFAGHETTVGLISKGLFLLLTHPEQLELLRASPELLPGAIEEMLRYDGPAASTIRFAVAPVELAGKSIEPHQLVLLALGAGNRDPAEWPDPDRFDVTRSPSARHLAFGQGTFYCLGAALARLEAEVCFSTLFRRLGEIRQQPAGATWAPQTPFSRALVALPVTFTG